MTVIEVTGPPGTGKTTYINQYFMGDFILLGGMPLCAGKFKRIFYSLFLPPYALAKGWISFRQIAWLFKMAMKYDESAFAKINAFRNSITKFCFSYFVRGKENILIDEGISHIPFVLGLGQIETIKFIELFQKYLNSIDILYIQRPSRKLLKMRILKRGHKRVNNNNVDLFLDKMIDIDDNYKNALKAYPLKVTEVWEN